MCFDLQKIRKNQKIIHKNHFLEMWNQTKNYYFWAWKASQQHKYHLKFMAIQ